MMLGKACASWSVQCYGKPSLKWTSVSVTNVDKYARLDLVEFNG